MLLKYIKLKNFRQYKGEQIIEFSTDKTRNITVILGDNTSGKTTFVQSFNWILYGGVEFQTKSLLNMDIATSMKSGDVENVVGEVVFEHEGLEYKLTRTESYMKRNNNLVATPRGVKLTTFNNAGHIKPIDEDEITEVINSILPKNLSSYFFFDGEKIEKISEKKDVGEAVKNLLGLQAIEAASKHLNPINKSSVVSKFRNAIQTNADTDYKNAKSTYEVRNEEKLRLEQERIILDDEIQECEKKIDEVKAELVIFRGVEEDQKKQKKAKDNKERSEGALARNSDMYKARISEDLGAFLMQALNKKALNIVANSNCVDEGVPNLTNKSIEFLLKRGICICGEKLEPGTECYKHILKEQSLVPPQSLGTTVRDFKKDVKAYEKKAVSFYESVRHYYSEITQIKKDIISYQNEIDKLEEKIIDADKGSRLARQLNELKITQARKQGQRDQKISRIAVCTAEINKANEIMKKHIGASQQNKQVQIYLNYAEALYSYLVDDYESKEKDLREKLNVSVNMIFSDMYHGKRSVHIKENYTVELLAQNEFFDIQGLKLDESRGLETVKNFAFIAGILKLAKEKLAIKDLRLFDDEEDISIEEIVYPLVMDAPFSNADEKHVSKISSVLPNIADQIIMVVMEKDWKYAEATISDKVGKQYRIAKRSETESYIKGE